MAAVEQCLRELVEVNDDIIFLLKLLQRKRRRRRQRRRWAVRPQNENRLTDGDYRHLVRPLGDMDEEMYYTHFRTSAAMFEDLARRVQPYISHQNTHKMPVTTRERLAVTLRFLAGGGSQKAVAHSYRLASSTVSGIVREMCVALWKALQPEFLPRPTVAQWEAVAVDFWKLWNFPNCVGSVDGKHINVQVPARAGSSSSRSRGGPSVVLMAACDARYRFTTVDVEVCGPERVAGELTDSRFGSMLLGHQANLPPPANLPGTTVQVPHVLVGDGGFPLHSNLMCPYTGTNLHVEKEIFNYRLSRARQVIDDSFGILMAKWRILRQPLECIPDKAVDIVKACLVLHNFLAYNDDSNTESSRYIPSNFGDVDTAGSVHAGEWRRAASEDNPLQDLQFFRTDSTRKAIAVRRNLTTFFNSEVGTLEDSSTEDLSF